jgi:hypothetical protein
MMYWPVARGWATVAVLVDGKMRSEVTLSMMKRGPFWVEVAPGRHSIEFRGDGAVPLHREDVDLRPGRAWLIGFRAAIWRPFMSSSSPRWCSTRAW